VRGLGQDQQESSLLIYSCENFLINYLGAPMGPGLPIYRRRFPALKKSGVKYISSLEGCKAWGYGAPLNYLAAKLMWDADADGEAIFEDWLACAYGPAAAKMGKLFRFLDTVMSDFMRSLPADDNFRRVYEMPMDAVTQVWTNHYWDIEALYKDALADAETAVQRERIEMFGDNMILLNRVLAEVDLVNNLDQSVFHRSPEEYARFQESHSLLSTIPYYEAKTYSGGKEPSLFIPVKRQAAIPHIPQGTAAPVIDGMLDDAAWEKVAVLDGFTPIRSKKPALQDTTVRAIHDGERLYLAATCVDKEIMQKVRDRDDTGIYSDDCLEVFMGAPGSPKFWHLTVNAANSQWDALTHRTQSQLATNRAWRSATRIAGDRWCLEICLPLTEEERKLGPGGLGFNLGREDYPAREFSTWSGVSECFPEYSEFGRLVLAPLKTQVVYENGFEETNDFSFWQAGSPRVDGLEKAESNGFLKQEYCGTSEEAAVSGRKSLKIAVAFKKKTRDFAFAGWRGPNLDLKVEKALYLSGRFKVQERDPTRLQVRIAAVVSGIPKGKESEMTQTLLGQGGNNEPVKLGDGWYYASLNLSELLSGWREPRLCYLAIIMQKSGGFTDEKVTVYVDDLRLADTPSVLK